ncbi:Putative lipoprotein LppJ [Mycobacterium simulans]|uniref:Lipoprotein LppJ n=1 Tax=Mycobacterium simulans TaxID=627089 RepID=A0A7Z7IND6_9MYCO|nr:hypothetical protein [Mycobacterium simulans]SOJ55469.1 Putative lipoprotein LppJ [Mycobacterium simulans]
MTWHDGKSAASLRIPGVRPVISAALAVTLILGAAFLVVTRVHPSATDSLGHPHGPATDDQTKSQVIESAKQIVIVAGLRTTTAGYLLMSCTDQESPPYQGAIHLTFEPPTDAPTDAYFREIAAALVAHGWTEGLPPTQHAFGRTVSKDAVTAIVYRHSDNPSLGVMRVYGECRNMNDHRGDTSAWTDITGEFTGPVRTR